MKYLPILLLFILSSCGYISVDSFFEPSTDEIFGSYSQMEDDDYIDHLGGVGNDFLNTSGISQIKLSKRSNKYLENIYNRVVLNNELLLKKNFKSVFYLIDDSTPFLFSLPKAQFFISTALIKKYIRHEDVLSAAITYEIVKTHHNLYPKKRFVPIGYLPTERIISLTRIPLEVRVEVDKWTFYALERAGFDSYAFMLWIQTQNKNALDFTLQYGDARGISREEFLIKSFLLKDKETDLFDDSDESQSSESFYQFINEVKRRSRR
ncbi:MAG: hypothetical protein KAG61_14270 [Bacteriovoracaceae bacterium]|nr:hypothetical protein [Bacteriovoracaceae bacterium]